MCLPTQLVFRYISAHFAPEDFAMKKILIAATLSFICTQAFAAQDPYEKACKLWKDTPANLCVAQLKDCVKVTGWSIPKCSKSFEENDDF